MSEEKINPYTGLPDKLFDTYAAIGIFEHPVAVENIGYSSNNYTRSIELPNRGWELICIEKTQKVIQYETEERDEQGNYSRVRKNMVVDVPVYICGKRRDAVMDELREGINKAEIASNLASYHANKAQEELEKKNAEIEELKAKLAEAENKRQIERARCERLEDDLDNMEKRLPKDLGDDE